MRCPRCGNENSEQNRFCGMCGASLLPAVPSKAGEPVSVAAPAPVAAEAASAPGRGVETHRPAPAQSPTISGPSFLGLSEPPSRSSPRSRASLSLDPHPPGRNLQYLLEEEEPQHHWGIGKILLILIALGLALGFGYLRFKNQGLAWLKGMNKPATAAQNTSTPESTSATPSSPSITPDTQPAAQPSTPAPNASAPSGSTATNVPAASSPSTAAPPDAGKPADTPKPEDAEPSAANSEKATPPDRDSSATDSTDTPAAASATAEKPKPAAKPAAPKPSAVSKPAAASDPVSEARRYLYGRGASQDCDRGLRLLKPAANQSNPKAMVEMGALYSAGLCTPRDLPTAYRWFALALRKDPENTAIQADLQKLWGEMTQPERQLAIKMTQ